MVTRSSQLLLILLSVHRQDFEVEAVPERSCHVAVGGESSLSQSSHWIIVIRHAESENNVRNKEKDMKLANPNLTALGFRQASALAANWTAEIPEIDSAAFLSSAFQRALLTIKPLAAKYGKPILINPDLGERGGAVGERPCACTPGAETCSDTTCGKMCCDVTQGMTEEQMLNLLYPLRAQAYSPEINLTRGWYFLDHYETDNETNTRAANVVAWLLSEARHRSLVVATHGNFLQRMLKIILKIPKAEWASIDMKHENTAVTRLSVSQQDAGSPLIKVRGLADTRHLSVSQVPFGKIEQQTTD